MTAEWFAKPVIEKLIEKLIDICFGYLKDQFRWQTGMKEELERLQMNYPHIQAVVFAATQLQIGDRNPALNNWLWQLRDAIDEADDLLDEFEYMKHKERLTRNMGEIEVSSSTTIFLSELRQIGERAFKMDPKLKKLEEVVHKIDAVSAGFVTFLPLLESTKQEQQEQQLDLHKAREAGSLPRNELIGRSEDKEFLIEWLRQPSNEEDQTQITAMYRNISLLSIVGHGGMGKTTILQHVYGDNEITKEFDLKIWVCVSNNSNSKKVIADMLECLKWESHHLKALNTLQEALKSAVQSKKFLLVLDDIWDEQRDKIKWEDVLAPLAYGKFGSKILITTRMDSVAAMIAKVIKKKKETLTMKGLEEDECLQLLNAHAFAGEENSDDYKKLRSITAEIVKKLSGSPLAAKVIGGALNDRIDERYWITVLKSDFRNTEFGQNDILSILRLSYTFLPKYLQNCFAYCSIFPQDYIFDRDDLVRKWIAVGFIQPPSNSEEFLEDIGGRYFDILVKKSFFEKHGNYKMHDLLHELAQSIFAEECFRIEDDDELFSKIPKTIRHLSVKTTDLKILQKITKFKNLRSLFLWTMTTNYDRNLVDILSEIFEASRSLRLLEIDSSRLNLVPETIGCLIHLRYLKITGGAITLLPRSLSNLYYLQFFLLLTYYHGDTPDNYFPKDFNNLFNLRHLKEDFSKIYGIGKLTSLQELGEFYVSDKNGYKIGELEHMKNLRHLGIKTLNNVNTAEEARNAKLCDKGNLTNLSLEWGDSSRRNPRLCYNSDLDERVLDNLQPHRNLKKLSIEEYMGVRSAVWMSKTHLMSNLEKICLNKCLEWETLPPFGQLPFLKSLYLRRMPKAKRLEKKFHGNDKDCSFPSLKTLRIEILEALEDWFDASAAAHGRLFPCLTELCLNNCPNLQQLPFLPPKLRTLTIDDIGWNFIQPLLNFPASLECLRLMNLTSLQCLPSSLSTISSLKILKLSTIPLLKSLPDLPPSLDQLILNDLESLDCLPSSLPTISSLKNLELTFIPLLKSLPDLPSSLSSLNLRHLESLDCLPSCLPTLSSLTRLDIKKVPQLQELPDLPPSLNNLIIQRCHPELKEFLDSDGHKTAHISYVSISTD